MRCRAEIPPPSTCSALPVHQHMRPPTARRSCTAGATSSNITGQQAHRGEGGQLVLGYRVEQALRLPIPKRQPPRIAAAAAGRRQHMGAAAKEAGKRWLSRTAPLGAKAHCCTAMRGHSRLIMVTGTQGRGGGAAWGMGNAPSKAPSPHLCSSSSAGGPGRRSAFRMSCSYARRSVLSKPCITRSFSVSSTTTAGQRRMCVSRQGARVLCVQVWLGG